MSDEAIGVLMPKILEAARSAAFNPGFSGATLSGCALDASGNVVLDGVVETVSALSAVNSEIINAVSNKQLAQSFQESYSSIYSITLRMAKYGSPTGALIIRLYDDNGGKPGNLIDTIATVDVTTFTTSPVNYTYAINISLTVGAKYWIKMYTSTGSQDASNYVIWYRANDNQYANGGLSTSADGGSTWAAESTLDFYFSATGYARTTSGTSTEVITTTSNEAWNKLIIVCTLPANTSATATINDIAHAELIAAVTLADGINIIDLSSIDARDYKAIELIITPARVALTDTTPEINHRGVYWRGAEIDSKYGAVSIGAGSTSNTELSITGGGCILYSITYTNNGTTAMAGRIVRDGVTYQNFTLDYGGSLHFGKGLVCNESLVIYAATTGKLNINYGY
jgi:hypothetical protein